MTMELHDDSLQNEAVLRCGRMNFITSSHAIPYASGRRRTTLGRLNGVQHFSDLIGACTLAPG